MSREDNRNQINAVEEKIAKFKEEVSNEEKLKFKNSEKIHKINEYSKTIKVLQKKLKTKKVTERRNNWRQL